MNYELLIILGTLAVVLLVALWTVITWSRRRSARNLLQGMGLILALVGLYLTGMVELMVNGVRSIYDWLMRTPMDTMIIVGLSLIGAGALLFIISLFIRRIPRDEAKQRRQARQQSQRGTTAGSSETPQSSASTPPAGAVSSGSSSGSSSPAATTGAGAAAGATTATSAEQPVTTVESTPTDRPEPSAAAAPSGEPEASSPTEGADEDADVEEILRRRGIE